VWAYTCVHSHKFYPSAAATKTVSDTKNLTHIDNSASLASCGLAEMCPQKVTDQLHDQSTFAAESGTHAD